MGQRKHQPLGERGWALVSRQHGVIARRQLLALGFNSDWITHRIETGWLHAIHRGVYAVGGPGVSRYGACMAAVLACGPGAVLSHATAAALWGIRPWSREIEVLVATASPRRRPGITVRRRPTLGAQDVTSRYGIPVTTPACTVIDLAARLPRNEVEAMLNEAGLRRLIELEALRRELDHTPRRPGVAKLRAVIDRRTFRYTRAGLERAFIPLALKAGLPRPLTLQWVNGFEVDFYFPDLDMVVETDGGIYHRTPAQQAADRRRDLIHTVACRAPPLRFTHGQIKYEPSFVLEILKAVAKAVSTRD